MSDVTSRKGWTRVAFGEVVQLSRERSSDPRRDGFERYIGLEHIDPADLKVRRWGNVSEGTTFTNVFRAGQVLFGKRRAYQRKVAVADFDGVCSGDIYVLKPRNEKLLQELLPFICQTDGFFEHAIETSAGSLSPRTNWDSLASFELALPPPDEQRRIYNLLNAADDAAHRLEHLVLVTESCVEATLAWSLERDRENGGCSTRDAGAMLCSTDGTTVSLGDCCDLITDGEHNTPPRAQSGIPLLSARNVLNEGIDLRDVDYVSTETFEVLARRVRPIEGDVLISCSGSIGRVCEVPPGLDFAMVRSVAIIRPTSRRLNSRFLAAFLRSRLGQQQIQSLIGQTAQGNLFQGAIRRIRIPRLPLDRQLKLAGRIGLLTDSAALARARVDSARSLRRELATTAFRAT